MITGHHFQNAYITRNIDKAVAEFHERADIRKIMEAEVPVQLWTPHAEGIGRQKLAFVWIGDMQFELIQPGDDEVLKLYSDELPEGDGLKFHHICQRVDDWEAFMARVEQQPYPVVLKGGTPGMLEFVYLDTREWLGHYVEYVWMAPERWAGMGGL